MLNSIGKHKTLQIIDGFTLNLESTTIMQKYDLCMFWPQNHFKVNGQFKGHNAARFVLLPNL